jgi:hypothetical protein
MTAAAALHAVEAIVCFGVFIASTEVLFVRDILQEDGFLSWRVNRLARPGVTRVLRLAGLDRAFDYPGVLGLIAGRALAALAVVLTAAAGLDTRIPLLLTALLTALVTLRGPQGNDGSDQMASILVFAALIGEAAHSSFATAATLIFIAVEAAFAYATAGFLKAPLKGWRDGSFVLDVLRTGSFGNAWILKTFETWRLLPVLFGLGVAFGDSAIAFAALTPPMACLALLAFGLALHAGIAIVLGLNTFVWSFAATYPAILWVSLQIYGR